ncbi:hypothetical protein SKAU_G00308960 [Synaphobranchus kaupii]|uniref:Uncharacterized protein n=1 Tax=Synaphobranchus kaupii TaxID=118154 RepID=A0A9Q1ERE7_SYNKA|nr:hypothetical protein SKAU_G00308960 [Synaphobranchus kaupii]
MGDEGWRSNCSPLRSHRHGMHGFLPGSKGNTSGALVAQPAMHQTPMASSVWSRGFVNFGICPLHVLSVAAVA